MSTVTCPHCQTINTQGNAFCQSCGMALPQTSGGPRVVTGEAMPATAAGQTLLAEQLTKQTRQVFWVLLAVGLIQMTCGAILVVALQKVQGAASAALPVLLIAQFIVAAGFIGLAIWSRKNPLPAAIVGLVVYCTLVGLNVIYSVSQLGQGKAGGIGGIGIGWLDIVIIVVLAKGIQAAIKHRKLKESALQPIGP